MDVPKEMMFAVVAILYAAQCASTKFSIRKLEKASELCEADRVRMNKKLDKQEESYSAIQKELLILGTPCLQKPCEREKFIRDATQKLHNRPATVRED